MAERKATTMHSTRDAAAGILIGIGCWLPILVANDEDGQGWITLTSLALFALAGLLAWRPSRQWSRALPSQRQADADDADDAPQAPPPAVRASTDAHAHAPGRRDAIARRAAACRRQPASIGRRSSCRNSAALRYSQRSLTSSSSGSASTSATDLRTGIIG